VLKLSFPSWLLGIVLTATLGCGGATKDAGSADPASPDGGPFPVASSLPFAVGGQRLQAWFLEAGASQIFDSFYDQQLAFDCAFVPTEKGHYACLPLEFAEVLYLDAACSKPASRLSPAYGSDAPPSWLTSGQSAPGSKRTGYHVAELLYAGGLEQNQPTPPAVFAATDAGCVPTSLQDAKATPTLYRLEPQDDETFVLAKKVRLQVADDFTVRRFIADDGAEQTLEVIDRDGRPCEPQPDGVCVPTPFTMLRAEPGPGLFLDASCAQPAFDPAAEGLLPAPNLGVDSRSGRTRAFELAPAAAFAKLEQLDPMTGAPMFDADGRSLYTCQRDARFSAWAPGPERTASLSVAAQLELSFGDLRFVQQRAPTNTGELVTPLEPGGVFVDQQGTRCHARATGHEIICPLEGPEPFARELPLPSFERVAH
jgi:hypothetical protein